MSIRALPKRTVVGIVAATAIVTAGGTYAVTTTLMPGRAPTARHAGQAAERQLCTTSGARNDCATVTAFRAGRGADGEPTPGDDYPAQWRAPVPQDSMFDSWGEYNRECTSWAAWALHSRNHFDMPFYDDARNWGPRATALGYVVDDTPAVGAVGWKRDGNHVVWVYAVNGDTVTIQEYNQQLNGTYSWRVVPTSAFAYIHFADLDAPAPVASTAPPVAVQPADGGTALQGGGQQTIQSPNSNPQPAGPGPQGSSTHVQGTSAGSGSGSTAPPPTHKPTSPPPPPPPATYAETTGGETHTWTDYRSAGGTEGQVIPGQTTVQIACKVQGFRVADGNTWWYRLASAPWSGNFYASADAFYNNGSTSGSLHGTPYVDPAVPDC